MFSDDFKLLNELSSMIRVDAKIHGISNFQLIELTKLYYENNGKVDPENLSDLLEVLC